MVVGNRLCLMSLPKGHLQGAGTKVFGKLGALLLGWIRPWLDNALVQSMQAGCWVPTARSAVTILSMQQRHRWDWWGLILQRKPGNQVPM